MTAAGHPRTIFERACKAGNLPVAEVTARELGRITLAEALELVHLIALKDPRRHGRAGMRWLRRYLDEQPGTGLDDVAFLVGCLTALGGPNDQAALTALRALAAIDTS